VFLEFLRDRGATSLLGLSPGPSARHADDEETTSEKALG
jgi:hypothetical protein